VPDSVEVTDSSAHPVAEADSSVIVDWLSRVASQRGAEEYQTLQRAGEFALKAHQHQTRASGEPYILHSLAVAEILHELRMDDETLVAAVLHDVVEDTGVTLKDIESEFGGVIAQLVDGVTKMGRIDRDAGVVEASGHRDHMQAESLRKLLLAMVEDVRVVLIKLADRLHNMRTLRYLDEARQRRIARETLEIYAPLANRLGVWQIKWELEDLALRYQEPETYHEIANLLDERRENRELYVQAVMERLRLELEKVGIQAEVSGRPKHIFSIWRKMQRKGVDFNQVFDVRAVRVLVEKEADCYGVLGIVHGLWRHIPREFDDYVANPKYNSYRSLHTAVIGPEGKVLEVQIRTHEMHRHAELGIAAHWLYKEDARYDPGFEKKIVLLRQLLDWKEEDLSPHDFVDRFKSDASDERVYVLTPNGKVIDLPQGATPLDFAYAIHTDVGHRCRGAKVDGRIVPLNQELNTGQQVEVLTTRQGAPSRDWLNPNLGYLRSSRSKAKVRQWFKHQDKERHIGAGRVTLDRELHRMGVRDLKLETIAARMHFDRVDDLLAAIGRSDVTAAQIAGAAHVLAKPAEPDELVTKPSGLHSRTSAEGLSIRGVGNLLTQLARCCRPVPYDSIVGYITRGRGVSVHRRDCANILRLKSEDQERMIEVEWGSSADQTYSVDIIVQAYDRSGLLRDISSILANDHINVMSANTHTNAKDHIASMTLNLEIANINQLSRILDRIAQLPNVLEARRKT